MEYRTESTNENLKEGGDWRDCEYVSYRHYLSLYFKCPDSESLRLKISDIPTRWSYHSYDYVISPAPHLLSITSHDVEDHLLGSHQNISTPKINLYIIDL